MRITRGPLIQVLVFVITMGLLIAMVGIGNGARAQIEAQVASLGQNMISVFPGSYGAGGGYADRGPREMHDAVCARCGKDTQVPFRPTGARPVYCSDCFRMMRD